MTEKLTAFLADREKRTLRMRDGLREVGFDLDEAEIEARIAEGKPIGRPHLAGAVLRAPANAERLAQENIDDIGSLIRGYLIEGKPAFRLRETPTVARGGRGDPRRGRRRDLGAPVLGHLRPRRSAVHASSASTRSGWTASRPSTSRTRARTPS